jgi:hypothetical protein
MPPVRTRGTSVSRAWYAARMRWASLVILVLLVVAWVWSEVSPGNRYWNLDKETFVRVGFARGQIHASCRRTIVVELMLALGLPTDDASGFAMGSLPLDPLSNRFLPWATAHESPGPYQDWIARFTIPIWWLMLPFGTWLAITWRRRRSRRSLCPCGYDARGLDVCPECGRAQAEGGT